MDGKIIARMDARKHAFGFSVGQRVRLKIGGNLATILGFGNAWSKNRITVFMETDEGRTHSCGDCWIEAL